MAQPKSSSTIGAVLEAINLLGVGGKYWLWGQQIGNIIMSQNYPLAYPLNYEKVKISNFIYIITLFTIWVQEWQLEVPNGYVLLVFESFDIPTYGCWVEVSYGSYSERFIGKSIPGPFTSTGQTMTVKMHTEYNVASGFRAVWGDSSKFHWVGDDNSIVDSSNWAPGFPVSGKIIMNHNCDRVLESEPIITVLSLLQ